MATDNHDNINPYEEDRKQRLLENKKRIQDLGILKISKSLLDHSKFVKPQQRQPKPRSSSVSILEPRRSSRVRTVVNSYGDDVDVDSIEKPMRRRVSLHSSLSYLARPVEEIKIATCEEVRQAKKNAEKLQSNLQTENPCFIKSMVRSHVYSCFWLGLPTDFCRGHLPKSTGSVTIVLEDENGAEYEAVYICKRTGLSGGWRSFALDHKLNDGDALVFELVEPERFKIYIVKASGGSNQEDSFHVDEEDNDSKKLPTKMKQNKKAGATQSNKKVNPKQASKRESISVDGSEDDILGVDEESRGSKKIPMEMTKKNQKAGAAKATRKVSNKQQASKRRISDDDSEDDILDVDEHGGSKKNKILSKSKNETKPTRVSARLRSRE